ncbi:hypothetical protein FH972_023211 [Carpinus fangiana]|uniref:BSD domain-containing protein n=1 Tax=Carpinus fangiana TaxID=176857 RepID=A0A5N6KWT0_9ROSI|nr:hypothetical protein FH972_023211 [Carpinus fangiana]
MDVAYDHVQEEALPEHLEKPAVGAAAGQQETRERAKSNELNEEVRDAYKSFTESAWGAKLGGFWGTIKKQVGCPSAPRIIRKRAYSHNQGEQYAQLAQKELAAASSEASKGPADLVNQTQSVNIGETVEKSIEDTADGSKEAPGKKPAEKVPESLLADIGKEAQSIFSHFRSDASKRVADASKVAEVRLAQVRAAEDAADEVLLKFGANIKSFLRDAVTITGPDGDGKSEVLFESKDAEGRRVVHATRFDAQLHVIHTALTSFTEDPASDEFGKWKADFNAEKKTDDIAADLKKYEELRRAMEKLVPEQVEYAQFWTRYYFLRHVVETEEQKRRELLKSQAEEEEVAWDDDDEEEATTPSDAKAKTPVPSTKEGKAAKNDLLKPNEGRRSNEHSVAGSDGSYDIVSGATSRGPGSPRESKVEVKKKETVAEESDEEDWE